MVDMKVMRMCLAAFVGLLGIGQVGAAQTDMDAWRKDLLKQYNMIPVTSGVRVSTAEKKAVWTAFRKQFGDQRVQMGRTTCVATNSSARLLDQSYRTALGERGRVGVKISANGKSILYRVESITDIGSKESLSTAKVWQNIAARVNIDEDRTDATVFTADIVLRSKDTVQRDFGGGDVTLPYEAQYFFFLDDLPEADWGHQSRFVCVNTNLTEFAISYEMCPARVLVEGKERSLEKVSSTVKLALCANADSLAGEDGIPSGSKFSQMTDVTTDNSYALIVSGGYSIGNNHCRYWNEVCFVYNVLHLRYGLPRDHIVVLWANGDPSKDLCRNGTCYSKNQCKNYTFETDSLSDFDMDGNVDINGAATRENVRNALLSYGKKLKSTDQLLMFCSDHGGQYGEKENGEATVCLWGGEMKDTELAAWTKDIACPVAVALKTCFGGGMISEFVDSAANRVIATADVYDQSLAHLMMGDWTYYFFSALCGYYPVGTPTRGSGMNPREVDGICEADLNGDGHVSFAEAHAFAVKMNPFVGKDNPQLSASTQDCSVVNLAEKFFIARCADMSPITREKVAMPVFNSAEPSGRFAPYAVTVSCGTAGATIRYTLDGSEPNEKSAYYTDGITIAADCTVKVRAFKSGMDGSDVASAAYVVRKTAPEAPYLTAVSQGDSSTGIIVNWMAGDGTKSVDILRGENTAMKSAKTVVSGLSAEDIAYADMTAVPGNTYYYQVRANNDYGSSLSAVSLSAGLQLMPPSGLTAKASNVKLTTADVSLSWDAVSGATHYRVWRVASDGTTTAVCGWTTSRGVVDSVVYAAGGTTFSYFVKAAGNASGDGASSSSNVASLTIKPDASTWSLVFCESYSIRVSASVNESTRIAVKPNESGTMYVMLKYADGTFEKSTKFLSGVTWTVASGTGLTLAGTDGKYASIWEGSSAYSPYTPPSVNVAVAAGAADQIACVRANCTVSGTALSGEFQVLVSSNGIIKSLSFSGPDFVVPGEQVAYTLECQKYSGSWWDDDLPDGTEVEWSIAGGSGVTIDQDGIVTGWPVTQKTSAILQAKVDTLLGPVIATKTISISPSTVTQKRVVIPSTGGQSEDYCVGAINTQTYGEWVNADWIDGISYYGSRSSSYNDKNITLNLGKGRNLISIIGNYLYISFCADRNSEEMREGAFKLRWDGGGVDFTIEQQQAPVAVNPDVSVSEDGLSASAQSDGSIVRYATDGEEPSEDSPVLDGTVTFERNTAVAVKAFGEWMQDSDTFYGDVEGNENAETVNITFDPIESGVSAPAVRQYEVSDTFGELPILEKEGMFFHGWTLHKGSSVRVSESDYVPIADAVLYARWSGIPDDEPEWSALPWNFTSSMTGYVKVYDQTTETWLTTAIVGVEDGDGECRGSSKNGFGDWEDPRNGVDGLCVFGIYGAVETGSETGLKFRVWIPGKGYATVVNADVAYTADADLGTEANPYVLNVKSALTSTLTLRSGWNWISLPLTPTDSTLASIFTGVAFNEDDIIKGGDSSQATYSGGKWNGSLKSLKTGECYLLYRAAAASATVAVSGTEPDGKIAVSAGWNMIGPVGTDALSRDAMTHSGGFAEDDVIKSDSGEQMTYAGGKWNGSLKELKPGVGYKAYLTNAGTLTVK